MKKRILATITVVALTLSMSTTAWAAGWKKNSTGQWYENDDGSYLTDTITPDGYYVNADGYWNGMGCDVTAKYIITGDRLFRTTSFTKTDAGMYTVTADLYDTAFFDDGTLMSFKKGDKITLPGLGTELTVKQIHKPAVLKSDTRRSTNYKVDCVDAEGNKYYLTPDNTTESLASNGEYVLILRPVATGITFTFDAAAHAPIAITGFRTTTPTLLESTTMYYKLNFSGTSTEANAIWDSSKNYIGKESTIQGIKNAPGTEPY